MYRKFCLLIRVWNLDFQILEKTLPEGVEEDVGGGAKRMEVTEEWRGKVHIEELYNLCSSPNMAKYCLSDHVKQNQMGGVCVTNGGKRNAHSIWWGHLKERGHLQERGTGGNIKCILKNSGKEWVWLTWLRIQKSGGMLWARLWAFVFHKMRRISWLVEAMISFSRRSLPCFSANTTFPFADIETGCFYAVQLSGQIYSWWRKHIQFQKLCVWNNETRWTKSKLIQTFVV